MNREIEFRGKSEDNNKWVYGDYIRLVLGGNIHWYIKPFDGKKIEVQPKTIGQYTGKRDSSGYKVFEGDKVTYQDHSGTYVTVVKWGDKASAWTLKIDKTGCTFATKKVKYYKLPKSDLIQVIGNIHDHTA